MKDANHCLLYSLIIYIRINGTFFLEIISFTDYCKRIICLYIHYIQTL